jgi:hypothetical protein
VGKGGRDVAESHDVRSAFAHAVQTSRSDRVGKIADGVAQIQTISAGDFAHPAGAIQTIP